MENLNLIQQNLAGYYQSPMVNNNQMMQEYHQMIMSYQQALGQANWNCENFVATILNIEKN